MGERRSLRTLTRRRGKGKGAPVLTYYKGSTPPPLPHHLPPPSPQSPPPPLRCCCLLLSFLPLFFLSVSVDVIVLVLLLLLLSLLASNLPLVSCSGCGHFASRSHSHDADDRISCFACDARPMNRQRRGHETKSVSSSFICLRRRERRMEKCVSQRQRETSRHLAKPPGRPPFQD